MAHLATPITPEDHTQGPDTAEVTLVQYGDYDDDVVGNVKLELRPFLNDWWNVSFAVTRAD